MLNLSDAARLINLPKIPDKRGNLSFFEGGVHIPFPIKRTYWIYDVPGGEQRGGHAYRTQHEFIIALSGSFDIVLTTATEKKVFHMNRSYYGLFVPEMVWKHMENFSTNSLAMVASSAVYDPADYIRDWDEFETMVK